MKQFECETCGAALEIENQFVRAVSCQFCGASYMISGSDGLSKRGQGVKLADYPSILNVGQHGTLSGRGFRVLGRVRYAYDAGFWEEWQIQWDDGKPPAWLEEDEGYWTLYKKERVRGALPAPDRISVGATIQVNEYAVFVTEKRTGKMVGMEGQFSNVMPLEGEFGYATGTADGKPVSITFWPNEIELEIGTDIEDGDLVLS